MARLVRAHEDGARIAQTVLDVQEVIRYVRKPTGSMPPYAEKFLSDQNLIDIYAYLKSLPGAMPAKDIQLLYEIN
jgi:mono/diheme cytochrome c family protein